MMVNNQALTMQQTDHITNTNYNHTTLLFWNYTMVKHRLRLSFWLEDATLQNTKRWIAGNKTVVELHYFCPFFS